MIFVTVGAQMPFDRLIRAVDEWAGSRGRTDVFAQVGLTDYEPKHVRWVKTLEPLEFRQKVAEADVVVAHAGMGSILTALELGKPIVVMPRRGALKETRNDHQVATAERFLEQGRIAVALDERELRDRLDALDRVVSGGAVAPQASPELLGALRGFVAGEGPDARRGFDGVVCFGGLDWWYHNRGHYDMQMARHLAAHVPVLYVNSIGMRVPRVSEGRMFFRRLKRKLKSFSRGLKTVGPNLSVFSPVTIPGSRSALSRWWLAAQVRRAARKLGMRNPLLWVACPPAAWVVDRIRHQGLVYQRTDRYEAFPHVDAAAIRSADLELKSRADLTLFCSSLLHGEEAGECRRAVFVDHGVDYARFQSAGLSPREPADVRPIARPRIGFVGSIDAHTFDPPVFVEVARRLPGCSFVLVGGCSLPQGWCPLPNVHLLGQKPYEQVADYMAACDVLIMPWNGSEWIKACNPVKLKEYLAVGRPVVTTPFVEARRYDDLVKQASGADAFVAAIRESLADPGVAAVRRAAVAEETWSAKAAAVLNALARAGVFPVTASPEQRPESVAPAVAAPCPPAAVPSATPAATPSRRPRKRVPARVLAPTQGGATLR